MFLAFIRYIDFAGILCYTFTNRICEKRVFCYFGRKMNDYEDV